MVMDAFEFKSISKQLRFKADDIWSKPISKLASDNHPHLRVIYISRNGEIVMFRFKFYILAQYSLY